MENPTGTPPTAPAPTPAPKKQNNLKYILLGISLFVITAVLVTLGVFSPKSMPKIQPTPVTARPTPADTYKHTSLSFIPGQMAMSGTQGTAMVNVDPGGNPVTAVQLEISYDPKVLTNVTVEKETTFFTAPIVLINKTDKAAGRITYALGITPAQQPISVSGNVVTVSFTKLPGVTAKETMIKLTPDTLVAATGIGPSVLKSSTDLTITF
jgi:hypothetical protein